MSEDSQLLQSYAATGSEAAFSELARRHVDLVYSAALRLLNGDAHRAQDLAQQVFCELARRAPQLARHPALVGWLYTTTRQMACRIIRTEQRRAAREQVAHTMNEITRQTGTPPNWDQLGSVLEDAMHELAEADRLAILMRFFNNKSLRDTGAELGVSENAARMRIDRALDRLRQNLQRKGISSTGVALATALSSNAVQTAPAAFSASIAAGALAGVASKGGTSLSLIKLMAATKLKIGLALVIIAGAAAIYHSEHAARLASDAESENLRRQLAQMKADNAELSSRLALSIHSHSSQNALANAAGAGTPLANTNTAASLRARLIESPPKVTAEQLEPYLKSHHRDATSLLAAYRVSHDPALLQEAMKNFPTDSQVDFEASINTNASPAERRQWLNALETSAPDNALANYLSAAAYFKSGQSDLALQEIATASGKQSFMDYTTDRMVNDNEAYLDAGFSVTDARTLSAAQLLLPQLFDIKDLGLNLLSLAQTYQQSGDTSSAQQAFQMAAALGQRYSTAQPGEPEVSQLVGMWIEHQALGGMDPNTAVGDNGQTAQNQLDQLNQARATLKDLNDQAQPYFDTMSDTDYMTYKDRWMAFGEEAALRWVINKFGQP